MPPVVAVDIGNTSLSAALFPAPLECRREKDLPRPLRVWRSSGREPEWESLTGWLPDDACHWRIGSVQRTTTTRLLDWLWHRRPQDVADVIQHSDLPLQTDVDHPGQVGVDRLAAALAANVLRQPENAAIVIDTGSAVTVDVVTDDGVFRGGVIFPGMQLCLHSLALGTDLLPALSQTEDDIPLIGKNTEDAMRSGVFFGVLGGIRETVRRMQASLGEANEVVVTGGEMQRLLAHLPFSARYEPSLVLVGLAMARVDSVASADTSAPPDARPNHLLS